MIDYSTYRACEGCGWKKDPKKECDLCALEKRIKKKSPVIFKGDVRKFHKYDYR